MAAFEQAAGAIRAMAAALSMTAVLPVATLADTEADEAKLAQCGKDICAIIVSKKASGPDLSCDLTKTWQKAEIQKGADSKYLMWGLGSAKCSAKIKAKRSEIIAAVTAPEITFRLDKQSIACEIGAERYELRATMAPELTFKQGATTAVSLHMDNIHGAPLIKGVVWTAATLEENFGILQKDMVREVNRFIKKECPKILGNTK
jgi:hypothetical protein